jgi:dTDP-glucose 4,6-dehydratase
MKVVVTGGAGFIGSNLVYYLRKARPHWEISVIDALTYAGNLENILSLIKTGQVNFSKLDITDATDIEAFFSEKKHDIVFHLAAESHVDRSIHSAAEFVSTNVAGTQNLITACRVTGVKRFVHVSTDEVYGSLGDEGFFTESTPLDPTSPYAASKAASDLMVLAAHKTHGMDTVITRCTNNYGPYQFPEKLIPLFITNALENKSLPLYGDGANVRSWIFVDDHSEALLKVCESGKSGQVYNIGGGHDSELSNRQVTSEILKLLGKSEDLIKMVADRPAHDRRYAVDISKIESELGWSPKVKFSKGIEQTINWYLSNPDWWQSIKSGDYLDYYKKHYGEMR